jgi:tight adherence protein C
MTSQQLLLGGSGAVFVGLAVALVALLRTSARPTGVARSLALIETVKPDSGLPSAQLDVTDRLLRPGLASLARLVQRFSPVGTAARLQRLLDLAGNPRGWWVERILATKAVGLIVGVVLGVMLLSAGHLLLGPLWLVGGGAAGYFLPDVLVYNAGLKRQQALQRSVPDALDMLTVCVEAGLAFDAGLAEVARNAEGPIAGEFARLLSEMQIGKTRIVAFQDLAVRTTVPELRILVSALVQSDRLGIPLAGVLREQSSEMRLKRRQRAEEQAQKVPVKILFPLLLCIFPALFVVILGPGLIQISHTFLGKT